MDFSLTTVFVVPVGQTALPSTGSTDALTPGQLGLFNQNYAALAAGGVAASEFMYVAQGRANNYLQGSKRSDKIAGRLMASKLGNNVTEWYSVRANPTAANQIMEFSNFKVPVGEDLTLTFRAHSSYIDTLYFNGLTKSVTVPGGCLECGADPCLMADNEDVIDAILVQLGVAAPGTNPDNSSFSTYFTFEKIGTGAGAKLRVSGKALTKYGVPCDIAADPHEYDRMYFKAWAYTGPATTADFYTSDACNIVADIAIVQNASYASGTSEEIAQLEKNYYSYQAGYLKHLYRNAGYNQNFESFVAAGQAYDTFYIKFRDYDVARQTWGDYITLDSMVIIAVATGSAMSTALEAALEAGLGPVAPDNALVTTTTTVAP